MRKLWVACFCLIVFCQTAFALAKAGAFSYQQEGRAGQTIVLRGDHSVYIVNTTSIKQYYQWVYKIQVEENFIQTVKDVYLDPGKSVFDHQLMYLSLKIKEAGHAQIEDSTVVSGESRDHAYAHATLIIHH